MIKINPSESPEIVVWIMKNIINAIKAPDADYTPEPGIRYFQKITGHHDKHNFNIEYIAPQKRGQPEQIYASFDDIEVQCDLNIAYDYFSTIDNYINKKYMYDENSEKYVLRPQIQPSWKLAVQWFKCRKR